MKEQSVKEDSDSLAGPQPVERDALSAPCAELSAAAYQSFLGSKRRRHQHSGFSVSRFNPSMMDFQQYVTAMALEAGRFAIFGDCGTGKTIMQLEWGQRVYEHTSQPVLIFAPLAVSLQTKREGAKFGYDVAVCREQSHVKLGLNITNYEMARHFDPRAFSGIVLDESSILKSFTGATRNYLIESWAGGSQSRSKTPEIGYYPAIGS